MILYPIHIATEQRLDNFQKSTKQTKINFTFFTDYSEGSINCIASSCDSLDASIA